MSEPVTLYRNEEQVTIVAPSEVRRLLAEGWTLDPWKFTPVTVEPEAVEPEPQFVVKRGRPKK